MKAFNTQTKLPFETPITKVHHAKASTTITNPTTASTTTPDNSVFLKQFIDKNVKLKQMGTSCNVIKTCCPQFPSNLKSIFASDKRRAEAVNYVKKLRSTKSQVMDITETQVNGVKDSMSKIFNESPIRAVPPSSYKNILHQPCNNAITSRYEYSTPNMFANYTSRAPLHQHHHQHKKQIDIDNLFNDDYDYDDVGVYNGDDGFEKEEVFFYDDKAEDDDDEVQVLYSKKQSNVYKPLDIHVPEIPVNATRDKFNGYVIVEYDNGSVVNEVECKKFANWKKINERLLKDKVELCGKMLQFVDLNEYEKARDIVKEYERNKKIKRRQIGVNTVDSGKSKERKGKLVKERVEELMHVGNSNKQQETKKIMRLRRQKVEKFSYIVEESSGNDNACENVLASENVVNIKYIVKQKRKVIKRQNAFQYEYVKTTLKKYNVGVNTMVIPFKVCRNVQVMQVKGEKGLLQQQQQRVEEFSQLARVNKIMVSESGMNTEQEELCVDKRYNNSVEYIVKMKEYVDKDTITDVNTMMNVEDKVIQTEDMCGCKIMKSKEMNTEVVDYKEVCKYEGFNIVCNNQLLHTSKEDVHIQTDIETKDTSMITDNAIQIQHTITNIEGIEYVHYKECESVCSITTEHVIEYINDKTHANANVNVVDIDVQTDNENEMKDNETNTEVISLNEITFNGDVEFIYNKNIPSVFNIDIQTDGVDIENKETNTELVLNRNEVIVNDNIEYIHIRTPPPQVTETEMQTEEEYELTMKQQNKYNNEIQNVINNEYIITPYKELKDEEVNTETVHEIIINEHIDFIYNKTLPHFEIQNQISVHYEITNMRTNTNEISSNNNIIEYIHNNIETKDNETNISSTPITYEIITTNNTEYIHVKPLPDISNIETQTQPDDLFLNDLNLKSFQSTTEQLTDEYPTLITQPKSEQQSETQDYQSNSNQYSSLEQPQISLEPLPIEQDLPLPILKSKTVKPRIIPKDEAETLNIHVPPIQNHFSFNDSYDEIIIPSASVKEKIHRIHSAYGIHSIQPSIDITIPTIMTVLSHKPVALKKKKKFTYTNFNENYSKSSSLQDDHINNIIAARGKALLFRQKLKKNIPQQQQQH